MCAAKTRRAKAQTAHSKSVSQSASRHAQASLVLRAAEATRNKELQGDAIEAAQRRRSRGAATWSLPQRQCSRPTSAVGDADAERSSGEREGEGSAPGGKCSLCFSVLFFRPGQRSVARATAPSPPHGRGTSMHAMASAPCGSQWPRARGSARGAGRLGRGEASVHALQPSLFFSADG